MILGDAYNGKTSIINRLKSGTFIQFYQVTVSLDFVPIYRKVKISNEEYLVKTTFVDTAGAEIYGGIGSSFIKQCDGFVIIYNISNKDGLINIKKWKKKIDDNSKRKNPPIMLFGNKLDLERKIKKYEAIKLSEELNIDFGDESSCKDLENRSLENNMDALIAKVAKVKMNNEEVEKNTIIGKQNNSGGGCCK